MSFRAQQLLRAAFSLGSRASSSSGTLLELGAARGAAAALAALQSAAAAGMQQGVMQQGGLAAIASLAQLQRGLHTGLPSTAAAAVDDAAAAMNPLQQAPPPAAARSILTPAVVDMDAEGPLRARAVLRGAAISPRKLNMFAKLVRGLCLEDALIQCDISCKKSAAILRNVLLSAKANAVNNHGLDAEKLMVEEAWVGKGTHLKRTSIHGRGRSGVRLRYRSHLTVVLAEKEGLTRRTRVMPMLAERYLAAQHRRLRQQQRTAP